MHELHFADMAGRAVIFIFDKKQDYRTPCHDRYINVRASHEKKTKHRKGQRYHLLGKHRGQIIFASHVRKVSFQRPSPHLRFSGISWVRRDARLPLQPGQTPYALPPAQSVPHLFTSANQMVKHEGGDQLKYGLKYNVELRLAMRQYTCIRYVLGLR